MSASAQSARYLLPTHNSSRYWPVIVGSMIIMAAAHTILWISLWPMTRVGYGDFSAFYCAGKIVQQGQAYGLYDLERQAVLRKQLFPEAPMLTAGLPFFHPAYESLVYSALAYLPYRFAYLVWNAAGLVLLLIVLRALGAHLSSPLNSNLFLVAGSLAYFPLAEIFLQGQDDVPLLLAFGFAYLNLARGRDWLAGATLALGLFKFHFVLPAVALLLCQKRWRFGLGFATGAAALTLLSIAVTGWPGAEQYASLILHLDRMPENSISAFTSQMPNLRGALVSVSSGFLPQSVIKVVILLTSVLILVLVGLSLRKRAGDLNLSFSAATITAVLVSYHANMYDLSLLLFPLLFLGERLLTRGGRGTRMQWAVIGLVAFSPLYHLLLAHSRSHILFWPVLALLLTVMKQLNMEGKRDSAVRLHQMSVP